MNATQRLLDVVRGVSDECLVIAEIAQAHDGSLGTALAMIDAAAEAGAIAVKFQTHIAEAESTLDEPWRVRFSDQDATRFDYWRRMGFSEEEWGVIAARAEQRGVAFVSSPFSAKAVDLLVRVGCPVLKVASGEMSNPELLDAVAATGLPVILSSGMSPLAEVDAAVALFREAGVPLAVMQCMSEYPTPPEHWGLDVIPLLRERHGVPVGLSDHSGTVAAGIAAAALGATLVEVHVTFDRRSFGPDVPASITFDELAVLTRSVQDVRTALSSGADKDALADRVAGLRSVFGRSWALVRDLPAGTMLEREHLTLKKPAGGFAFEELDRLVGARLVRDARADRLLTAGDVEVPS